jgi:hypothetical protein
MASGDSAFENFLRSMPRNSDELHAEVLLLNCIDYRFFTIIAQAMHDAGWERKYDHFILAGASLGALLDFNNDHLPQPKPPKTKPALPRIHWQQVFIEHLQLATQLHTQIHSIIIIEHRKCGAYETFLEPGLMNDEAREKAAHKQQADKLEQLIYRIKPGLTVTKWLASLDPRGVGPLDKSRKLESVAELCLEQL